MIILLSIYFTVKWLWGDCIWIIQFSFLDFIFSNLINDFIDQSNGPAGGERGGHAAAVQWKVQKCIHTYMYMYIWICKCIYICIIRERFWYESEIQWKEYVHISTLLLFLSSLWSLLTVLIFNTVYSHITIIAAIMTRFLSLNTPPLPPLPKSLTPSPSTSTTYKHHHCHHDQVSIS